MNTFQISIFVLVLTLIPFAYGEGNQTISQEVMGSSLDWIQSPLFSPALSISALATILTFWIKSRNDKQSELKSNFLDIVKITGDEDARLSRGIILRHKELLKNLSNSRDTPLYQALTNPDKREDLQLQEYEKEIMNAFNNVIIAYNRLGFILFHDKHLRKKILSWTGFTMYEQWQIIGKLLEDLQKSKPRYGKYFSYIGKDYEINHESYEKDNP